MRIRELGEDVDSEVVIKLNVLIIEVDVHISLDRVQLLAKDGEQGLVSHLATVLAEDEGALLKREGQLLDEVGGGCFEAESALFPVSTIAAGQIRAHTDIVFHIAESLALRIDHDRVPLVNGLIDDDHIFVGHVLIWQST